MAPGSDYFDGINFDRHWEEEDWERFFDAQDRLTSDRRRRVGHPPERPSTDPGLSFRRVMHQFGMDPDNPESPPRPFALDHVLGPDGAAGLPFWHPSADPERLPLFLQAAEYFRQVSELVEIRYAKMLSKTYKSASHRQFQKLLPEIEDQARAIPRLVALGHRTGYDPFGAKEMCIRDRSMTQAIHDLRLDHLTVVFPGTDSYKLSPTITATGLSILPESLGTKKD